MESVEKSLKKIKEKLLKVNLTVLFLGIKFVLMTKINYFVDNKEKATTKAAEGEFYLFL